MLLRVIKRSVIKGLYCKGLGAAQKIISSLSIPITIFDLIN